MADRLSETLGAPTNVKATRAEGLGAVGRAEGVASGPLFCWPRSSRHLRRGTDEPDDSGRRREPVGRPRGSRGGPPRRPGVGDPRAGAGAGGRRSPPARGLGGDQVEGRHAVRELLAVGRRATRSVLMAEGQDESPLLDEIEALAARRRVRVDHVSARRLEAVARTEAPQGVVALARPSPRPRSRTSAVPPVDVSRFWWWSTG